MAIENVMMETQQVKTYAVCCTADLKIEAINQFLVEVHQKEQEERSISIFTVVHDLKTRLNGTTKELRSDDKILKSPFAGLDYPEVQSFLQQMVKDTGSKIDTEWFLVLDDESERTSSGVIVVVESEYVRSVRVTYPTTSRYLAATSVAHPGIDEMIELASDNYNGILQD
ncbi:unnamed protein product [Aureobasidium pullulans]|nr:unnamed protein product [Aureobasidium pullulans]